MDGKIAIKKGATVVKEGGVIDANLAGVLGKLGIEPMRAGFEPLCAYDSQVDKVYVGIKIDKENALNELRIAIGKAFGFSISQGIVNDQTVKYFIARAGLEAKALEGLEATSGEVKVEEAALVGEVKVEENSDSNNNNPESGNSANDQEQESKEVLDNKKTMEDNK